MDLLQREIYNRCLNIGEIFANGIDDLIEEINNIHNRSALHILNRMQIDMIKMQNDMNVMQNNIEKYKEQLLAEQKQNSYLRLVKREMSIIIEFISRQFSSLWNALDQEIIDKYNTVNNGYPYRISNDATKYALLIINDKHVGISKKLAQYYLNLEYNNHPKIELNSDKVRQAINNVKKATMTMPIDIEMLDELERLVSL